jgi:hypothetical protein
LICVIVRLSAGFFQQALFQLLLAGDAIARPRNSLKPLGIDVITAIDAFSKNSLANASKRYLNHLQQLPLVVALVKEKFFGVGIGCTVSDVLSGAYVRVATVLFSAGHNLAKVLLPFFQLLPEIV